MVCSDSCFSLVVILVYVSANLTATTFHARRESVSAETASSPQTYYDGTPSQQEESYPAVNTDPYHNTDYYRNKAFVTVVTDASSIDATVVSIYSLQTIAKTQANIVVVLETDETTKASASSANQFAAMDVQILHASPGSDPISQALIHYRKLVYFSSEILFKKNIDHYFGYPAHAVLEDSEDGQENLFNEHGEKVYDPMEDVLTQIDDPNIVLETITNRETYLSAKRPEKATGEPSVTKPMKSSNLTKSIKSYSIYSDTTRESFIDRMLEQPQERGLVAKVARELNVKYRTALNWWHIYEETEGVPYKNSEKNSGPKSSFTTEHNEYITKLLDNDPQIFADDIINSLTEQFEGFTISKSQMNNHSRNTMLITLKPVSTST
ncbi:hypothetical protein BDB00DRAFT_871641 [Zychaea mexicana]|uniref:uncharacterized protein n=1 Tax=Zychaea mexicana TaxID=64656 RepID=UPI0022FDF387|nr:uncharacterized protein BDB00DRAFT_871641 [Zychaea mexicana]KAI9494113.1 hypothetical protein BDB00DRAFT_871641 [Zychaea mexicana]